MDRLLLSFRRGQSSYLASRGISSQDLVDELLQVCRSRAPFCKPQYCSSGDAIIPSPPYCVQLLMTTSDKNDTVKLAALAVFQEAVSPYIPPPLLSCDITTNCLSHAGTEVIHSL